MEKPGEHRTSPGFLFFYTVDFGIDAQADLSGRVERRTGTNRQFSSAHQLEIVSTFDVNRTCARPGTENGADSRPFAAAGDRPDDGTDCGTNRGPFSGPVRLAVITHGAFSINKDSLAAARDHIFK